MYKLWFFYKKTARFHKNGRFFVKNEDGLGPGNCVLRSVARAWPEDITFADLRDVLPGQGDNALRYRLRELVKADTLVKQDARRTMRYVATREPEL